MMKNYLPLGSVVLLKGATKKVIICGRIQAQKDSEDVFDYSGFLYPEGMLDSAQTFLFNNEDIEDVYFIGMQDEEELKFRKLIISKVEEHNRSKGNNDEQ